MAKNILPLNIITNLSSSQVLLSIFLIIVSYLIPGVDDKYAETVRNVKSPGEARKLANENKSKYRKDW